MSLQIHRLRRFVVDFASLMSERPDEDLILDIGGRLLSDLVSRDDWLPEAFAQPFTDRYAQYLLHCDSLERFSIVAFAWGPSHETPVHNHTVWGLVGVLRGAEASQRFEVGSGGLVPSRLEHFCPGDVDAVSPSVGDVHQVSNALSDAVSISIHVYGANIGAVTRSTFDAQGHAKSFISGYANTTLPNFWGEPVNPGAADVL